MIYMSKMLIKILNDARERVEEATGYDLRSNTDIDVLIVQAGKLIDEIEKVSSEENTPEELEYIEALEMQLDRYLLAIKYS